jgi:methyl-accepting chemotaxis protein
MRFLLSLSIARRTALVLGLLMASMVVITLLALTKYQALTQSIKALTGEQVERIELSQRWDANIREAVARWHTLALAPDPTLFAQVKDVTLRISADTTRVQKRFTEIENSDQGKALGKELGEVRTRWLAQRDAVRKAIEGGDADAARQLGNGSFDKVSQEYLAVSARHAAYQIERARQEGAEQQAQAQSQLMTMVGVAALCLMGGLALGVVFVRTLMRPIDEAVQVAERIASGDLTAPVHVNGNDEMARMLTAMRTMQARLSELIGNIGNSAQSLVVASGEIAQGNNDLSERTERTASSLQQAASAMEEIVGTVGQTAASTRTAKEMAEEAGSAARSGGQVVTAVVRTMSEISEASRRIGDIVGTIDSLAFQTNILALNAAVEAARAGEQGRGFAVVAAEVRALAKRSADASREIRLLIQQSTGKVEDGARLVEDAGRTMEDLVSRVARVGEVIREISVATEEQSQGLAAINGTVAELDRMTQQNAALVEQSAAAASAMGQQAQDLSVQTGRFRIATT